VILGGLGLSPPSYDLTSSKSFDVGETNVEIKVLGSGCAKCNQLEEATKQAVARAGLDAQIEKVTDVGRITGYGVMTTPALVVDDQVRVTGKVPSVDDLVALLTRV
jgi:small redox-active disulfide protein 2